jgi:hypothetical protein
MAPLGRRPLSEGQLDGIAVFVFEAIRYAQILDLIDKTFGSAEQLKFLQGIAADPTMRSSLGGAELDRVVERFRERLTPTNPEDQGDGA